MPDPFNPYREWLGREDGRQPANHYELLGISPGESDPAVISRAADGLIARVRRARPGANLATWQQLLDLLGAAKSCLLDPASRTTYDAAVRAATGPTHPAGFPSQTALPPSLKSTPPKLTLAPPPLPSTQPAPTEAAPIAERAPIATMAATFNSAPAAVSITSGPIGPGGGLPSAVSASVPAVEPVAGTPQPLFPEYSPVSVSLGSSPATQPSPSAWGGGTAWPATTPSVGISPGMGSAGLSMNEAAGAAPAMGFTGNSFQPTLSGMGQADAANQPMFGGMYPSVGATQPASLAWGGAAPMGYPTQMPAQTPLEVPAQTPTAWSNSPGVPTEAATPQPAAVQPAAEPIEDYTGAEREFRSTVPAGNSAGKTALRLVALAIVGLAVLVGVLALKKRQQEQLPVDPGPLAAVPEGATGNGGANPATTDKDATGTTGPKAAVRPAAPGEKKEPAGKVAAGSPEAKRPGPVGRPPVKAKLAPMSEDPYSPGGASGDEMAKADGGEKPGEPKPEAPADPQKQQAMKQSLTAARAAMAGRDLPAARKHVKAAAANAQTPQDEAEVARVDTLLGNLEEFWKGLAQVMASLVITQEFIVGNTPMIVVQAQYGQVTFRSEGANRTYTLKTLPGAMALGLAREGFQKHSSTKILLGTFLAMDAQGDRAQAARLWQEAAKAGEDVKDLLAELGVAAAGGAGVAPGKPGEEGGNKLPVPTDPAKLEKAKEAVQAKFQADYAQATAIPGKAALAQKLLEASRSTADPDLRYAMLREAREQAIAAAKCVTALETVDQIALFYAIDPIAVKTATLEQLGKAARVTAAHREVAEAALGLIAQFGAQRPEEGARLAALAFASAQKGQNPLLSRRAKAALQQFQGAKPGKPSE